MPVIIISVNRSEDADIIEKVKRLFTANDPEGHFRLISYCRSYS